jgi:D-glycero-alpha-D-manno-heptose-7-phosphate kinase
MILTRTPLRISLFGGGSDIPSYYMREPGRVLSFTIDKYMYIALCKTAHTGIKLVYHEIEIAASPELIAHTRVRECLAEFDINSHIEISSFCEIPTKGTGLGSSSTFTVGLINALSTLKGTPMGKGKIAELACSIEIDRCGEPIGKQDQYAATFGGMNIFGFHPDKTDIIKPRIDPQILVNLNSNLMMFYTGITRSASDILNKQTSSISNDVLLRDMIDLTYQAETSLKAGFIDDIGDMLDKGWHLKRQLADNVSNEFIDSHYTKAINAGALGGKILGAGGGGYFLFYVPSHKHESVRHALSDLTEFKFNFENSGTTIVYNESKRTF